MSDQVVLDDFIFNIGPRRQIDVSSPRNIAKIDIPGKAPVYQDMGEDEHTIGWGGVLVGDDAYDDMSFLEAIKGKEVKLLKGSLNKTVRIKDLTFNIVRDDYIEYSINLIEIQEENLTVAADPDPVTSANASPEETPQETETVEEPTTSEPETTYEVVGGDTLWAIAQNYLGDGNRWNEIADLNGVSNPRLLQIGTVLTIPA